MKSVFILLFFITLASFVNAQDTASTDYYKYVGPRNLSRLWTADSIENESGEAEAAEKFKRVEPIGFYGKDYQRFQIHLSRVVKSKKTPYEYLVRGKVKYNGRVRSVQGTIKVLLARLYDNTEFEGYKEGYAICDALILEDKNEPKTGFFKGRITTHFLIDDLGNFRYNGAAFVSDQYTNNQFEGYWASYTERIAIKCNWGDYRIPDSNDLDVGEREFTVNPVYLNKGWETYSREEDPWWN